jgi:hypothetical protein
MNRVSQRVCLSVAALSLLAAPALATAPTALPPTTGLHNTLLAQAGIVETVLYFETATMAVRVYRSDADLFMNLYNKATDVVEVRAAPAQLVASTRDQTVYTTTRGEADRFARINVLGETELEIIAADGSVVLQEPGFNAVVGVTSGPSDFRGNNFAPGTPALVLSAEAARLRSGPRLGSTIVGTAPRRAIVDVLDRVGNPEDGFIWYQVIYDGTTGWVRGDLLQPT